MLGSFQPYLLSNCWKYLERDLEYAVEPSIGERREVLHFLHLYDKSGEQFELVCNIGATTKNMELTQPQKSGPGTR